MPKKPVPPVKPVEPLLHDEYGFQTMYAEDWNDEKRKFPEKMEQYEKDLRDYNRNMEYYNQNQENVDDVDDEMGLTSDVHRSPFSWSWKGGKKSKRININS